MLQFDIEFDEKVTREQYSLVSKIFFKQIFKKLRSVSIIGMLFISIGLIAGIENKEYINPFTLIGIADLLIILVIGSVMVLFYQRLRRILKNKALKSLEHRSNSHYEFNDHWFSCSNDFYKMEIKWSAISSYSLIENNVFIMLFDSFESSHIIGKSEISDEDYNTLIEILNKKTTFKEFKI